MVSHSLKLERAWRSKNTLNTLNTDTESTGLHDGSCSLFFFFNKPHRLRNLVTRVQMRNTGKCVRLGRVDYMKHRVSCVMAGIIECLPDSRTQYRPPHHLWRLSVAWITVRTPAHPLQVPAAGSWACSLVSS